MRCFLILLASAAFAQPSFDVASVKQSRPVGPGESYSANLGSAHNGIVAVTNGTLTDCIKFAYGLVSDDQVAGPDWIKSREARFDILAKAPPSTPREQLLLMLRALLDERFHLVSHPETRNFAHLVLSPGKNGSKMKEVTDLSSSKMSYAPGHITHTMITMHTLALLLSRQMRQLVLDRTGLPGFYAIDLQWTPDGVEVETGPTVFTAVQEQLGLKLESRKDGVEVMVIDRADRVPVAN